MKDGYFGREIPMWVKGGPGAADRVESLYQLARTQLTNMAALCQGPATLACPGPDALQVMVTIQVKVFPVGCGCVDKTKPKPATQTVDTPREGSTGLVDRRVLCLGCNRELAHVIVAPAAEPSSAPWKGRD